MISPKQHRYIFALLHRLGIQDEAIRKSMIYQCSEGKTTSIKQMTTQQAKDLIFELNVQLTTKQQLKDRMRKQLIAISYSIGEDINFVKRWCEKYGIYGRKKTFNDYNSQELKGLIEKFKKVQSHHLHKIATHH